MIEVLVVHDDGKFRLMGAPVKKDSFGKANALRLWEYGVGDTVRQSTFASVRRIGPAEGAAEGAVGGDGRHGRGHYAARRPDGQSYGGRTGQGRPHSPVGRQPGARSWRVRAAAEVNEL